jgi:hypothetical protein
MPRFATAPHLPRNTTATPGAERTQKLQQPSNPKRAQRSRRDSYVRLLEQRLLLLWLQQRLQQRLQLLLTSTQHSPLLLYV